MLKLTLVFLSSYGLGIGRCTGNRMESWLVFLGLGLLGRLGWVSDGIGRESVYKGLQ